MELRKVVIPVAGRGTRFLPATKAVPKEMLPVVDRPLIQHSVEEAVGAGFRQVILVTASGKESIEDHFDVVPDLERALQESGKEEPLAEVRRLNTLVSMASVRQKQPLGVGHAVLVARELVGKEPFGVMFPDDLILSEVPVLRQLRRVHGEQGGVVLAVEEVPREEIGRYGVIRGKEVASGVFKVEDLVEKPDPQEAPSNLGIVGRYILEARLFAILEETSPGVGGEIQLTDAIRRALQEMPCHAVVFEGRRYDCGNKLGALQAAVAVGLRHPELAPPFRRFLEELLG